MPNEIQPKSLNVRALIFMKLRQPHQYKASLAVIRGYIENKHMMNAQLSSTTGAMDMFLTFDAESLEEIQDRVNDLRENLSQLIADTQTYVGSKLI